MGKKSFENPKESVVGVMPMTQVELRMDTTSDSNLFLRLPTEKRAVAIYLIFLRDVNLRNNTLLEAAVGIGPRIEGDDWKSSEENIMSRTVINGPGVVVYEGDDSAQAGDNYLNIRYQGNGKLVVRGTIYIIYR